MVERGGSITLIGMPCNNDVFTGGNVVVVVVVGFRKGVGGEGKLESEMLVSVGSQSIVYFNCLLFWKLLEVT
jgi:hypothetical protein